MNRTRNAKLRSLVHDSDLLQHHGILGMHWGIRRFQPYGQGYDPDHEGKEIGLAARMGGHGGSFSSTYGRSPSKSDMIKNAIKGFGKSAKRGIDEGLERLNYANDRLGQGLKKTGKNLKSGLAKYAAGYDFDTQAREIYEKSGAKDLAKGVFSRFGMDAKQKVSNISKSSWDDIKSAMGSGVSSFENTMKQTKLNSKQFATNAMASMAFLSGAADRKSSASQILEGRERGRAFDANSYKTSGATIGAKNMRDLKDIGYRKPGVQTLSKTVREMSPAQLWEVGSKDLSNKLFDEYNTKNKQWSRQKEKIRLGLGDYALGYLGQNRMGKDLATSSKGLDLSNWQERQVQYAIGNQSSIDAGRDLARRLGIGF